eukprot:5279446-Pyramimonas_sp.AAC.1
MFSAWVSLISDNFGTLPLLVSSVPIPSIPSGKSGSEVRGASLALMYTCLLMAFLSAVNLRTVVSLPGPLPSRVTLPFKDAK